MSKKVPHVAIMIGSNRGWGWEIINGILAYAQEVGPWNIWIKPNAPEIFEELPKGWKGDGVIARITSPKLVDELSKSGLPVVNVADDSPPNFRGPSVLTDDPQGARIASDFFINKGFRHIAYIGPADRSTPMAYHKAFEAELAHHEIPCESFLFKEDTAWQEEMGSWLESLPKPVGILSCGINIAQEIIDYCMEHSIDIPHDISVLSTRYDALMCHSCFPPLSGILAPTEQIGYQAAKRMHMMLNGEAVPPEATYLPPRGIMEKLSTDTLAIDDPQMIQVVEFLKEHAYEPITMNDVLKEVPMARRSLERRFQKIFGHTPRDEIRRLRIDKARQLLADTDLPMQHIAEACGYATYNYLTHAFKQATGMAPRDYRKQSRS